MSRNQNFRVANSSEALEIFVASISPYINWKYLAVFIFILSLSLFSTCLIGENAPESDIVLEFRKLPLTADQIEQWCRNTSILAEQRERKRIRIEARSLPELIDWSRRNPMLLERYFFDIEPETYLGLTSSIEHARTVFRLQVEHELHTEEAFRLIRQSGELADRIKMPECPRFEEWELNDLGIYESYMTMVEDALNRLLPDLPVLIPAWQNPVAAQEDVLNSERISKSTKAAWRIVNKSRFGPKIIRVK